MATPPDSQFFLDSQTQAELDLLAAIVENDTAYPWNFAELESESYLNTLEQEFSLSDAFGDSEITEKSQLLFGQLAQLWTATDLQNSLRQKFDRLPQDLIARIAQSVQNAVANYQSLADRMVQSALDVLPQWPEEDLQVLARPLAYAMREVDGNAEESVVALKRPWTELSEIEQARVCLVVARYGICECSTLHSCE